MSSPAVQLTFTLRTSPNVRTVHLVGSWDSYKSQLPLAIIKDAGAKPGSWKGTFRFQGNHALKLGSRYWYYYIVDGYHVSHDPAKEFTTEKTTGRKLNILEVPSGKAVDDSKRGEKREKLSVQTKDLDPKRSSRHVVQGRPLSPNRIVAPRPTKHYASKGIREADYETSPIDDLEERFASHRIRDKYSATGSDLSDGDSSASGTTFSCSSPGSESSRSDLSCRCNRYGVTRSGQRIKMDCGGKKCGYSGESSECNSEEEDSESEESETEEEYRARVRKERERAAAKLAGGNGRPVEKGRSDRGGERRREVVVERRRR